MSLNQYSSLDKKEITSLPYMYANYKLNDDANMEVDNEIEYIQWIKAMNFLLE